MTVCRSGRTIAGVRVAAHWGQQWRTPGNCEACGDGPLHGARACTCALLRDGRRLCRRCAAGFDLATAGSTRIDLGVDRIIVGRIVDALRRGERVLSLNVKETA